MLARLAAGVGRGMAREHRHGRMERMERCRRDEGRVRGAM